MNTFSALAQQKIASRAPKSARVKPVAAAAALTDAQVSLAITASLALMEANPSFRWFFPSLVSVDPLPNAIITEVCDAYTYAGGANPGNKDWRRNVAAALVVAASENERCRETFMTFRHRSLRILPAKWEGSIGDLFAGQTGNVFRRAATLKEALRMTEGDRGNLATIVALPVEAADAATFAVNFTGGSSGAVFHVNRGGVRVGLIAVRHENGGWPAAMHGKAIALNFDSSACFARIVEKSGFSALSPRLRASTEYFTPDLDFLFPSVDMDEATNLRLGASGSLDASGLFNAMVGSVRSIRAYDPAQMCELPVGSSITSRPAVISRGATALGKDVSALGFTLTCPGSSLRRLDVLATAAHRDTAPLLPPFGSQLLAYYTPGFHVAAKTVSIEIRERKVVMFEKGKSYLVLPSFEKQVIEVAPVEMTKRSAKKTQRLIEQTSIIHSYQRFLCTSELAVEDMTAIRDCMKGDATHTIKTGSEAEREKQIRRLEDTLTRTTRSNTRKRIANELSRIRDMERPEDNGLCEVSERDPAVMSAFLGAFPPPKVPTVVDRFPSIVAEYAARAKHAVPSLTPNQLHDVSVASLKNGIVITHAPSAGKTRIAIAIACAKRIRRVLYISKAKNIAEADAELAALGMPHFQIRSHADIDFLKARIARNECASADLPEFYTVTQEFLALGDLSNQIFDKWPVFFKARRKGSAEPEAQHCVWSRRHNSRSEVQRHLEANNLSLAGLIPYDFGNHVEWCPQCVTRLLKARGIKTPWWDITRGEESLKWLKQTAENCARTGKPLGNHENKLWTRSGTCRACDYSARTYVATKAPAQIVVADENVSSIEDLLGIAEVPTAVHAERASFRQFPAYRRLQGCFDLKMVDEVHHCTGDSLQASAVSSIRTNSTIVMSGTLTRKSPEELWKVFSLVFPFNSPQFPYRHSERHLFIESHVTKTATTQREVDTNGQAGKVVKRTSGLIPEPSNTPRLWRILRQAQIHRTEKEVDTDLNIPPSVPHVHACEMEGDVLRLYSQVEDGLLEEAMVLSSEQHIDVNLQTAGWFAKMANLAGIGFEAKLPRFIASLESELASGRKCVAVVRSIRSYERLVRELKARKLPFAALDTQTCKAEDRRAFIDRELVHGTAQILVSRTTLINEALNNLTAASSMHVLEHDYTFHATKQLERRLTRPTQKAKTVNVHVYIGVKEAGLSIDQAMLLVSTRRREANTQLIDGASLFRESGELVRMATKQRQEQMEVLMELVRNNQRSVETAPLLGDAIARQIEEEIAGSRPEVPYAPLIQPPLFDLTGFTNERPIKVRRKRKKVVEVKGRRGKRRPIRWEQIPLTIAA